MVCKGIFWLQTESLSGCRNPKASVPLGRPSKNTTSWHTSHYNFILKMSALTLSPSLPLYCSDDGPAKTRQRSRLRGSHGLPPVTPNACVRDAVCSLVFDQIWNEIITVLQPLLASIREKGVQGR